MAETPPPPPRLMHIAAAIAAVCLVGLLAAFLAVDPLATMVPPIAVATVTYWRFWRGRS